LKRVVDKKRKQICFFFRVYCSLKDEKARLSRTLSVVARLGDPHVSDFDALAWARYRQSRLKDATPSTVNHEQRYLCLETAGCSCPAALHSVVPMSVAASRRQGS
jgi:hypothetical protein